jgi:hypothetical protein
VTDEADLVVRNAKVTTLAKDVLLPGGGFMVGE